MRTVPMVSLCHNDILIQHPSDEDTAQTHIGRRDMHVVIFFSRLDVGVEEIAQHEMFVDWLRCGGDVMACFVDLSNGRDVLRTRSEHDGFEDFVDAENGLFRPRSVAVLTASCFDDAIFGHNCGGGNGLIDHEASFGVIWFWLRREEVTLSSIRLKRVTQKLLEHLKAHE